MIRTGCLIVVSGLPGSGKTTKAKELEAERPGVRFCPDEWMTALGANLWDSELRANVEAPPMKRSEVEAMYEFMREQSPNEGERRAFDAVL